MKTQKTQQLTTFDGKVQHLNFDFLELLDCGDGKTYYVKGVHLEDYKAPTEDLTPYYNLMGSLIFKDGNEWVAVTTNMLPKCELEEEAIGKIVVFVSGDMTEWLAYWNGEAWVFVEMIDPETLGYDQNPRILLRRDVPAPTMGVSFAHLAEDVQGNLFVVQGYNPYGIPLFVEETVGHKFPIPILPRQTLQRKRGVRYAFDHTAKFSVLIETFC